MSFVCNGFGWTGRANFSTFCLGKCGPGSPRQLSSAHFTGQTMRPSLRTSSCWNRGRWSDEMEVGTMRRILPKKHEHEQSRSSKTFSITQRVVQWCPSSSSSSSRSASPQSPPSSSSKPLCSNCLHKFRGDVPRSKFQECSPIASKHSGWHSKSWHRRERDRRRAILQAQFRSLEIKLFLWPQTP